MVFGIAELSAAVAIVATVVTIAIAIERKADKKAIQEQKDALEKETETKARNLVEEAKATMTRLEAILALKQDASECHEIMRMNDLRMTDLAALIPNLTREISEARSEMRSLMQLLMDRTKRGTQ
jgi:hypothetical protein